MAFLLLITFIERIPPRNSSFFVESSRIINMNDSIRASSIENLFSSFLPVSVAYFELNFRIRDNLLEGEAGGIPKVDGEIIRGRSN